MTLVRVLAGGRVTLPREIQEQLRLEEGDIFEAEVVDGGLHLRPITAAEREQALERMLAAKARVRPTPEQAKKSPEEQERKNFDEVKAMRREHAQGRAR